MARPVKWRNVCCMPERKRFGPLDLTGAEDAYVVMTIDEYEAIRLIDFEGFSQGECAQQMNVARSTVQGIYQAARKKLAASLVQGKVLLIEGGEYRICNGLEHSCNGGCYRRKCGCCFMESSSDPSME